MYSIDADFLTFLASTELLNSLDEHAIRSVAEGLVFIGLGDGQMLMREGDPGDDVYLILSGRVRVAASTLVSRETVLAELGPGQTAGEMALLTGDRRSASVVTIGETHVAKLSRSVFERFAQEQPEAARRMIEVMRRRLRKARLALALRNSSAFASLDEHTIRDLENEFELVTLSGGTVLFRQGDPGDALYFVVSGRLRVVVDGPEWQSRTVAEIGCGETVGEMSVVSGEPRSATIYAMRDTHLARLSFPGYQRLLARHPQVITQTITRKIISRLKDTTSGARRVNSAISTIAVIPAGSSESFAEFCNKLNRALSRLGPTLYLSSETLDGHLGRRGISQATEDDANNVRIVEWLSRQESERRFILYQADRTVTPWTRRCVRQADQIMIVASAWDDPGQGEIEQDLGLHNSGQLNNRNILVLLHRSDAEPSGTKRWLAPRQVLRHHHACLESAGDISRIARFLTGRAVGITLGGGFARGIAHAGVFRAFADSGIAIDAIGGTSMGAVLGAQFARGWDPDVIVRETCSGCVDALSDLTFPFIAFHAGRKFSRAISRLTGDLQIEDLRLPYFCVSANLNRAELKIHTEGSLTKAVLASSRAPGIFPPIVYDGELHVDGGVLNNVPVDLMKAFCNGGFVVGVDVSPPHELSTIQDYGIEVSGWEALRRRFSPTRRGTYVPSILLVMMRTLEFGGISYKSTIAESADLYLQPPLLEFKRTDFARAADIAEVGYRHARQKIREWLNVRGTPRARRPDSGPDHNKPNVHNR